MEKIPVLLKTTKLTHIFKRGSLGEVTLQQAADLLDLLQPKADSRYWRNVDRLIS